jgi:hypothetical protein
MEGNLKLYYLHALIRRPSRDLIRFLPARSACLLSPPCRGFPGRSILDFARNDKICAGPLVLKMIDILFNSFTCDAVPGLSGISWI